jgi:hypothetical protein
VISALLAAALCAAPDASYAVIVGNNMSPTLGRRPLQYADDDAMKYEAVFRGFVDPSHLQLLTAPDDDTARLFPEGSARAVAPTKAALQAAFARVAEGVRDARAQGKHTRLYFVFAGHGDVDEGKGFLELQDGPFNGDDLEAALRSAGADEAHVILDSCNSFFVLAPRKPGGRHFTTPKDAALQLAERMPNVGVLLSTSAEAEVYEWSELQSGIFSHAVRSALTGAADVNGDGQVSYAELAAFVDTATRSVPNPNFRPQIFARGPGGDAKLAFASLPLGGTQLAARPDKPLRLVLRDAAGLRWFDVHAEANTELRLRLPAFDVAVERVDGDEHHVFQVASGRAAELDQLPREPGAPLARGATDALRALFASPFGPGAFAQWEKRASDDTSAPPEYIGLARRDLERMRMILRAPAMREERSARWAMAFGISIGVAAGAAAAVDAASRWNTNDPLKWEPALIYGSVALGGLVAGLVVPFMVNVWRPQLADFDRRVAEGHWQEAVAGADEFIESRSNLIHIKPWAVRLFGGIGVGVGILAFALTFLPDSPWSGNGYAPIMRGLGVACAGLAGGMLVLGDTGGGPDDDVFNIWREEKKLSETHSDFGVGVAPVPGGAALSFSGSF